MAWRFVLFKPWSPPPSTKLAPDPEAPDLLDTGLAELASLIDVLSRPFTSVFTSTLFDSIRAEAEEAAREWGDDGTRSRSILHLVRVIGYAFPPSGLVGSGYARRAVEAARHASLVERREEEAFVAALEEQKRRGPEGARVAALEAKELLAAIYEEQKRRDPEAARVAALEAKGRCVRVSAFEAKERHDLEETKRRDLEEKTRRDAEAKVQAARAAEEARAAKAKAKKKHAAASRAARFKARTARTAARRTTEPATVVDAQGERKVSALKEESCLVELEVMCDFEDRTVDCAHGEDGDWADMPFNGTPQILLFTHFA